ARAGRGALFRSAGIVDEDVDPAEALADAVHETRHRGRIEYVRGDTERPRAVRRLELADGLIERFLAASAQRDIRAFGCESFRRRTTDAARAARDDCHLSL